MAQAPGQTGRGKGAAGAFAAALLAACACDDQDSGIGPDCRRPALTASRGVGARPILLRMADVFISYARADRTVAEILARTLEECGWSVWWDREILGGQPYDEVIERELDAARCVIVLWSGVSVGSNWVKSEAEAAADRGVLVPVLIEGVRLPLGFRRWHTIDLIGWRGDPEGPQFKSVLRAISGLLGQEVPARASEPEGRSKSLRSASSARLLGAVGAVAVVVAIAVAITKGTGTPVDRVQRSGVSTEERPSRVVAEPADSLGPVPAEPAPPPDPSAAISQSMPVRGSSGIVQEPVAQGYAHFRPCRAGAWNVIVASGFRERDAGVARIQSLRARFPGFQFKLFVTVAADGSSNVQYAIVAGHGLTEAEARALASKARAAGIAPDAYPARQGWDSACSDES